MTYDYSKLEALPCPFCGGPARTYRYNGTMQATCARTYIECAGARDDAPVAMMWNRRAPAADAIAALRKERDNIERQALERAAPMYPTFNDWFDEIENFSLRSERCPLDDDGIAWLKAAFEAGRAGLEPTP
jgi:hypothetical protein